MTRVIQRVRLPYHPLLGRSVNHDSASRAYPIPERDVEIRTVQHRRYAPIFDQGQVGSCTGNAGVGCTATGPLGLLMVTAKPRYTWDEDGAVALYSRATALDDYNGTYPDEDTGSDGLSVAKALKEAGEISGYLWAFSPTTMRTALMATPRITGIAWYKGMFSPQPTGEVTVTDALAGGHEIVVTGYTLMGAAPSSDDKVWFDNSWGTNWGVHRPGQDNAGSFWMKFGAYADLLADNGDVTQFIPADLPAPVPTPTDDPDTKLWQATAQWRAERHVGDNAKAASAVKAWGKTKGFA